MVVCIEKKKEDVEEDVEEKNRGRSCLSHNSQLMQYHTMPSLCVCTVCVCTVCMCTMCACTVCVHCVCVCVTYRVQITI